MEEAEGETEDDGFRLVCSSALSGCPVDDEEEDDGFGPVCSSALSGGPVNGGHAELGSASAGGKFPTGEEEDFLSELLDNFDQAEESRRQNPSMNKGEDESSF